MDLLLSVHSPMKSSASWDMHAEHLLSIPITPDSVSHCRMSLVIGFKLTICKASSVVMLIYDFYLSIPLG